MKPDASGLPGPKLVVVSHPTCVLGTEPGAQQEQLGWVLNHEPSLQPNAFVLCFVYECALTLRINKYDSACDMVAHTHNSSPQYVETGAHIHLRLYSVFKDSLGT